MTLVLSAPGDLTRQVILSAGHVALSPALHASLAANRTRVLAALDGDAPVYGVNTGMGAMSTVRLDAAARSRQQNNLMMGRAVGSAPWLGPAEARAVVAARLRTLLHPAAGVSPELCLELIALLDDPPLIPARGGAAGEIIPLAHLGLALLERGYSFGAKEGVALLEGVPGLTGLAVLLSGAARVLLAQVVVVTSASLSVARASRDPLHPSLADGPVLAATLSDLSDLSSYGGRAALQAPVSFRVTAPAVAVAMRAVAALEDAVDRALTSVTDSPAFLDDRFVGTFGYAGTDLATACATLTTALTHLAELSASRLHRLLDNAVTGLPRQLSDTPGLHAGMVTVHKRAVGTTHRLRRFTTPALIGPVETSLGQEDVQSFGFESAECLTEAVTGLRDVLAAELLTLHQATNLGAAIPPRLTEAFRELAATLPPGTADRPFGPDLDHITDLLTNGWAAHIPQATNALEKNGTINAL